jgi:cysteinyl-tRNA synthetase
LLGTHYHDPLDWTADRLHQARQTLDRWYRALALPSCGDGYANINAVLHALDEDLNAPLALRFMHDYADALYQAKSSAERSNWQYGLKEAGNLLGLLQRSPTEWLRGNDAAPIGIAERIAARVLARQERRFGDADQIRDELAAEGIILKDKPDGTTEWRRV